MERKLGLKIKVVSLLVCLIIFFLVNFFLLISPCSKKDFLIEIKKNDTFVKIASVLAENKIVRSKNFFLFLVKILGKSKKLKVGIYKIEKNYTNIKIIKLLTSGNVATKTFTIPEGFNMFQIAKILEEKNIVSGEEFLKECRNPQLLKEFNINSTTVEGFLFPDTYYVPYNIDAKELLRVILKNFYVHFNELYFKRLEKINISKEDLIKVASLVEWEAKFDYERPIIASVFLNRLKRNLNLASCATVLYGLGHHKQKLLFKDLKLNSPYNTYLYKGLPPTPICNPGINSILAVLYPAKVEYLYFVSMGNGRHFFSKTYSQHLKAYQRYILNK